MTNIILELVKNTTILEWIGVLLSIFQAVFAKSNKAINYLFAFVGVSITIYIFTNSHLYAQAILNVYYLIMSFYGYYIWKIKKVAAQEVPISHINSKDTMITTGIVIGTFLIFSLLFQDATNAISDALVSAFGFGGMWLMAKRKIENWILLNISNVLAIQVQYLAGLYVYMVLSIILFCIGTWGYFQWLSIYKAQKKQMPK